MKTTSFCPCAVFDHGPGEGEALDSGEHSEEGEGKMFTDEKDLFMRRLTEYPVLMF